jgi:hypothetical protein
MTRYHPQFCVKRGVELGSLWQILGELDRQPVNLVPEA